RENADPIADSLRCCDRPADACVVKNIGLDDLRRFGRFSRHLDTAGMPHRHPHRRAALQEQRHEMAADKAGSAKHRNAAGHHLPPQGIISILQTIACCKHRLHYLVENIHGALEILNRYYYMCVVKHKCRKASASRFLSAVSCEVQIPPDVQQCDGLRPLGALPLPDETSFMSETNRPPWQPLP